MKSIPITNPLKPLTRIISRFNLVLFIVLVSAGLTFAVLVLNDILTPQTNNNSTTDTPTTTSFDQSTINRLVKFETSVNNKNYQTVQSGRINPFSE